MVKLNGNTFNFFETGYILIGNKRFDVEEITVNASRDLNPYHVASQRDPISLRPGRNKIDFTLKRAFSDAILAKMYDECCIFAMLLMNNDIPDDPQGILLLEGCRFTQDNIGPINGADVVSEDLQGTALTRTWETCAIKTKLDKKCSMGCPDNIGSQYSDASVQETLSMIDTTKNGSWVTPWQDAQSS